MAAFQNGQNFLNANQKMQILPTTQAHFVGQALGYEEGNVIIPLQPLVVNSVKELCLRPMVVLFHVQLHQPLKLLLLMRIIPKVLMLQ